MTPRGVIGVALTRTRSRSVWPGYALDDLHAQAKSNTYAAYVVGGTRLRICLSMDLRCQSRAWGRNIGLLLLPLCGGRRGDLAVAAMGSEYRYNTGTVPTLTAERRTQLNIAVLVLLLLLVALMRYVSGCCAAFVLLIITLVLLLPFPKPPARVMLPVTPGTVAAVCWHAKELRLMGSKRLAAEACDDGSRRNLGLQMRLCSMSPRPRAAARAALLNGLLRTLPEMVPVACRALRNGGVFMNLSMMNYFTSDFLLLLLLILLLLPLPVFSATLRWRTAEVYRTRDAVKSGLVMRLAVSDRRATEFLLLPNLGAELSERAADANKTMRVGKNGRLMFTTTIFHARDFHRVFTTFGKIQAQWWVIPWEIMSVSRS
jgi:hypothetical protein